MVQVVNQIITYSSNLIDGENYRVHYRTAHAWIDLLQGMRGWEQNYIEELVKLYTL